MTPGDKIDAFHDIMNQFRAGIPKEDLVKLINKYLNETDKKVLIK